PPCGVPSPCGQPCHLKLGPERHAVLDLGSLTRLAVIAVPGNRGSFREQAEELFAQVRCLVKHQPAPLNATTMTVFLRDNADESACEEIIRRCFGDASPVTMFVVQPPCCGAALGLELWAAGGPGVRVERFGPHVLAVESEGVRWIHCAGVRGRSEGDAAYGESFTAFQNLEQQLSLAGVDFDQVVRTWIYLNQITAGTNGLQRYQELNRARTDFFGDIQFGRNHRATRVPERIYPASTGIGTSGSQITMSCLALDSRRPDVFILPLENPQQTPACAYHALYSPQTPKFARAMAVVQGHFISTLVSGTASIVDAKSVFPGDVVRQTEQTLDNIARLIAPENFARHGMPRCGAALRDVAKLRVYVKHLEDYERCQEVVERLLPNVPAIYLQADVCRPDLLVEIEAVAFSPFNGGAMRVNGHAVKGVGQQG
ncbi:MAG TPA: Rid family hydrolase, partial [Candidatus Acidoferrum sp.]|nr:Rid family hydrolase [Candidatus Acidoferrum sp.]